MRNAIASLACAAVGFAVPVGAGASQAMTAAGSSCASSPCMYISNAVNYSKGSVTVYPLSARHHHLPVEKIEGRDTRLAWPASIAVDASRNIYVANVRPINQFSITAYAAGSSGDAQPMLDIAGSNTVLYFPASILLDASANIYVGDDSSAIRIFAAGSNGNIAPMATIAGADTGLNFPSGLAFDAAGNIYAGNQYFRGGTVTVYPAGQTGDVLPMQTIAGSYTGLWDVYGVAVDAQGNIYVANCTAQNILVFAAGATGNVAPIRTISGPDTGLSWPAGVSVAPDGTLYVTNGAGLYGANSITVYAPAANGDAKPLRTLVGRAMGLNHPYGIAIH